MAASLQDEEQRPRQPLTALQRTQSKFVAYAAALEAHLNAVAELPGALKSVEQRHHWRLAEVAVLLGTAIVTPREIYRICLPNSTRDPQATTAEATALRNCLRRLYCADPDQLHQSATTGKQMVHILIRLEHVGSVEAGGLAPECPVPAPWRSVLRYQLPTAAPRVRVTTLNVSLPDAAPVVAPSAADQSAAAESNTSTESTGCSSLLQKLDVAAAVNERWLALPPLPRGMNIPPAAPPKKPAPSRADEKVEDGGDNAQTEDMELDTTMRHDEFRCMS